MQIRSWLSILQTMIRYKYLLFFSIHIDKKPGKEFVFLYFFTTQALTWLIHKMLVFVLFSVIISVFSVNLSVIFFHREPQRKMHREPQREFS